MKDSESEVVRNETVRWFRESMSNRLNDMEVDAIIINPGALTHSSWALRDALDAFDGFAIEVHISNPAAREPFRHVSTVAGVVDGSIAGFGAFGYELAAYSVLRHLS